PSGANVRKRRRQPGHEHVDVAGEEVGERRPDPAVVTVDDVVDSGGGPELLEREVIEQADAAGAPVELVRVLLRVADETLEVGHRYGGVEGEQVGRAAYHGDGGKVAHRVVVELSHRRVGTVRADVAHHQRVAVRRRARGRHRGDRAAAAGRVLHEEGLAE